MSGRVIELSDARRNVLLWLTLYQTSGVILMVNNLDEHLKVWEYLVESVVWSLS